MPGLYQFFHRHVERGFSEHGLGDPAVVDYVSDLLARFARTSALYAVKDAEGAPLERVAQVMMEIQRAQGLADDARPDRPREALLATHLGEYTLFMSGLFRERLKARGELNYYVEHGRSAYRHSAGLERNAQRARLFNRLYVTFDRISGTLDHIRREQFPMQAGPRDTPLTALWRR